jgi:peptidoglycan/xylan/chitin deacetylase (PgdA/CDA1 family)
MKNPYSYFISTNLIVNFHRIPSSFWFKNIIRKLSKLYTFVSIKQIEEYYYSGSYFNNCCHISFDDGDNTVFKNAFPILKEFNIPATLFVSPKIIVEKNNYWFQEYSIIREKVSDIEIKKVIAEKTPLDQEQINKYATINILKNLTIYKITDILNTLKKRYKINATDCKNMTTQQITELMNSDLLTIGAHTLTHPILANESQEIATEEIKHGISQLKQITKRDIRYFAYPNGRSKFDFNIREEKLLLDEQIKLAFTTVAGFFNKNSHPLRLPRIGFFGSQKENSIWVYVKIMLAPIWKVIEAKKEINERKKIKKHYFSNFDIN